MPCCFVVKVSFFLIIPLGCKKIKSHRHAHWGQMAFIFSLPLPRPLLGKAKRLEYSIFVHFLFNNSLKNKRL